VRLYATAHPATSGVDISSGDFWRRSFDERERSFARLRAEAPVSWHPATDWHEPHPQQGFWALTRAADIAAASMNPDDFRSGHGITLDPVDPELAGLATFILSMDPPRHSRYRKLISAAFTPKAVARLSDQIQAHATGIVDSLVGAGDVDFVRDCSARLPMATVSDLVGIPDGDRERVALAAERLVGGADVRELSDPAEAFGLLAEEYAFLLATGAELAAHRRAHPAEDLLTNLVQAEIDGERLSDEDIGAFLVLLSVAGNDTTKQSTTLGMLALQEHPDQRAWLLADLDARLGTAVEEIVRWVSPVMQMTRTAARDVVVRGAEIAAGDKVALFYCSANRDPDRIEDPARFDLSRERNPHLGFGGGGPHYCLGSGLARTQLRALLRELLTRLPALRLGTPVPLEGNFIHGASALPAHTG
jgi:cytochrome P450